MTGDYYHYLVYLALIRSLKTDNPKREDTFKNPVLKVPGVRI